MKWRWMSGLNGLMRNDVRPLAGVAERMFVHFDRLAGYAWNFAGMAKNSDNDGP